MGDPVKITRRLAIELGGQGSDLPDDAIDGFVGEAFGVRAPATVEESDQPAADRLVLPSGLLTVEAQPVEKKVERFDIQIPFTHKNYLGDMDSYGFTMQFDSATGLCDRLSD